MPKKLRSYIKSLAAQIKAQALLNDIVKPENCTLFERYKPKPGGQEKFWEIVPFGKKDRSQSLDFEYRFCLVRGGIGAGKSFCGAAFACTRAYYDPSSRGLISANEYGQLETSTLVALAEFCEEFGVPLSPKGESPEETAKIIASRRLCKIFDTSVLVLSANKFGGTTKKSKQSGRGLQIRWFWGDEWLYSDDSAFETINGRLGRGNGIIKGQGLITSSLNRNNPYNYAWDYFDDPQRDEERKRLYASINCLTSDNNSLDPDYYKSLASSYTPELAAIELRGEYMSLTEGKVYRHFKRDRHCLYGKDSQDFSYDSNRELYISFDFNWNPACAVIVQPRDEEFFVIKEFCLKNSDTFELAEAVISWLVPLNHAHRIYIYGDATGNNKSANSKQTNWQIVHAAFRRNHVEFTRKYGASNPAVLERVLSVNNLLMADRMFFCADLVPELIKDLEVVAWKGDAIDKSDTSRTHLSDALGYLICGVSPYQKANAPKRKRAIAFEPIPGLV